MTPTVLWIVGEPGVGKTTFARALLAQHGPVTWEIENPKWTGFGKNAAAAGFWRGSKFDGADTLSISQIKPAIIYWAAYLQHKSLTVLDGDKLCSAGAVAAVKATGARIACLRLFGGALAAERRVQRGTTQNATWVRGRHTKARNFYEKFDGAKLELSAAISPAELVDSISIIL